MRSKIATTIVIAAIIVFTFSQKAQKSNKGPSESDVIQLLPSNFEDTINSSPDPWLVYLYAPWCDHCKTMHPEWLKVAAKLKGKMKVAKIDPSDNAYRPKFYKLFNLVSFPHFVMLPAGPKSEGVYDVFEGARTASSIAEWALERMKVHKALAVDRIVGQGVWQENCIATGASVCIVAVLPSLLDSSKQQRSVYVQIVRSVTKKYRDKPVSFLWAGAGDHPDFETLFNLNSGFPVVILINPERRVFVTMKAGLTEENLQEWLEEVFRSKGGRRFSRFSKEITFNTVSDEKQADNEALSQNQL